MWCFVSTQSRLPVYIVTGWMGEMSIAAISAGNKCCGFQGGGWIGVYDKRKDMWFCQISHLQTICEQGALSLEITFHRKQPFPQFVGIHNSGECTESLKERIYGNEDYPMHKHSLMHVSHVQIHLLSTIYLLKYSFQLSAQTFFFKHTKKRKSKWSIVFLQPFCLNTCVHSPWVLWTTSQFR